VGRRFFISFNSKDKPKAHWIAWTLLEAGHEVAVYDWEINAGNNVPLWMSKRLAWADCLIAVVSPDYLEGSYSMMERAAVLWDDPTGEKGSLVPVIVRPTPRLPPLLINGQPLLMSAPPKSNEFSRTSTVSHYVRRTAGVISRTEHTESVSSKRDLTDVELGGGWRCKPLEATTFD